MGVVNILELNKKQHTCTILFLFVKKPKISRNNRKLWLQNVSCKLLFIYEFFVCTFSFPQRNENQWTHLVTVIWCRHVEVSFEKFKISQKISFFQICPNLGNFRAFFSFSQGKWATGGSVIAPRSGVDLWRFPLRISQQFRNQ